MESGKVFFDYKLQLLNRVQAKFFFPFTDVQCGIGAHRQTTQKPSQNRQHNCVSVPRAYERWCSEVRSSAFYCLPHGPNNLDRFPTFVGEAADKDEAKDAEVPPHRRTNAKSSD